MADTRRTLSAIQTLLADNTSGDISPQDLRDMLISLASPYGGTYIENRSTPVTITGSGATSDIKVSDILTTCTQTSARAFTGNTDGSITYTGPETTHCHVVCQASVDLATAATNNVVASIYKYDDSGAAWSRVAGSDAITTANNTTTQFIATHIDVMLDTNDKLVLALQNTGGTADVRLYTMYLFAMGMLV